jgi:thiol-disulfide isomerase/thioredoxin
MPKQAPNFSGPDLLGGPQFNLVDHKGWFVFVAFMGLPWCGPCKLELPHLQTLASQYEVNPATPVVDFVIVNNRNGLAENSAVIAYAKEQNITIPIVDDVNGAIYWSYPVNGGVPISFIVKPSGELCEPPHPGSGTYEQLLGLLLECGAPAPGHHQTPRIPWPQPPGNMTLNPAFAGIWPIVFPVPVDEGPGPIPKRFGLDAMSHDVVRALAIHDAASGLAHHEARTAIRSSALKAAATSLRRMESLATLETELGPLAPHAIEHVRRTVAKKEKAPAETEAQMSPSKWETATA